MTMQSDSNIRTFPNDYHDIELYVSDSNGVVLELKATERHYRTSFISWSEWDRLVAWVEWRRYDQAAK